MIITIAKVQILIENIMRQFGRFEVRITSNDRKFDDHNLKARCTSYNIDH